MIESAFLRHILLALTALIFVLLALRTLWVPGKVAAEVGYTLNGVNGQSELHAIYFGLWLVSGGLAAYASIHVHNALLGDFVGLMVLGQAFGRLVAALRYGWPQGPLLAFFVLEAVGGGLILWVRPG